MGRQNGSNFFWTDEKGSNKIVDITLYLFYIKNEIYPKKRKEKTFHFLYVKKLLPPVPNVRASCQKNAS